MRFQIRQHCLVFCICFGITFLKCDAFQADLSFVKSHEQYHSESVQTNRQRVICNVLAEPPQDLNKVPAAGTSIRKSKRRPTHSSRPFHNKNKHVKREDVRNTDKWQIALSAEKQLAEALEALQVAVKSHPSNEAIEYPVPFPSIRECNTALAAFGDADELLRALRLYFKMRKVSALSQRNPPKRSRDSVPIPTLVTFSAMMSRAVYLGKPLVAMRLWKIMKSQPNFFSSTSNVPSSLRIVPDVKAANILMNCYAKLGDTEAAQDLLHQMTFGSGRDVPPMAPNLVTYNTLLDACNKCDDLDLSLSVKEQLEREHIAPDARTYTTIIATVARKKSRFSGINDPTPAFSLLQEMQDLGIRPNGVTYSALIDVCGRCGRSDLALKGLRMMLDEKAQEQKNMPSKSKKTYTLLSEVGAWTAAINACGKAGRIGTSLKLFYSMPNFGVSPNTVTCGCIMDCLLRNGRTAESLDVLRYMKKNAIVPTEVMYTSLMTSASRLAQSEKDDKVKRRIQDRKQEDRAETKPSSSGSNGITAAEVYTELMASLMERNKGPNKQYDKKNSNSKEPKSINNMTQKDDKASELFRVSLVFQEMKAAGVQPDLASFNALLRSCANAGDVERAAEVLDQIRSTGELEPNDKTWKEIIRAAGKAGRSDIAISTWKSAVADILKADERAGGVGGETTTMTTSTAHWLSTGSLSALLTALIKNADDRTVDKYTRVQMYKLVVKIYDAIMKESEYMGMNMIDRERAFEDPRVMFTVLQAIVSLESYVTDASQSDATSSLVTATKNMNRDGLRRLAVSIVSSNCFEDGLPPYLQRSRSSVEAYRKAQSWL